MKNMQTIIQGLNEQKKTAYDFATQAQFKSTEQAEFYALADKIQEAIDAASEIERKQSSNQPSAWDTLK